MTKELHSNCCQSTMTVKGDSFGEGTNHYECDSCGEVCDIASDHIPDPEKMVKDHPPTTIPIERGWFEKLLEEADIIAAKIESGDIDARGTAHLVGYILSAQSFLGRRN